MPGEAAASSSASSRGVPGTRFSPIASAPARDRREHAVDVGDAADLDERAGARRWPDRAGAAPAATNARAAAAGSRRADERLADERGIEAERAPAGDGRRLADARLGDDQPIVGDELAEPRRPLGIDVERPQVAVVEPDEPRAGRERRVELARVVGLDERLEAEVAAPARPGAPAAAAGGGRPAAARGRRRPRGASAAGRPSTTNSLARTGTVTAARTARRSSTEPPNQCGSHSTEIAAAPPAS